MTLQSKNRRLKLVEFQVLLAMAEGPLHGYRILKEIERCGDGLKLGPATLYDAIHRLSEADLVEACARPASETDPADARRRYYRLTPAGRTALGREARRLAGLVRLATDRKVLQVAVS